MIQKIVFTRNWSRFLIIFLGIMIILLGDFNAKVERERIFSNRQLRMQYYIRMIIVLE